MDTNIWANMTDAENSYKEYLSYASAETISSLSWNDSIVENTDVVQTYASKCYPITKYLKHDNYCSKLNLFNLNVDISVIFNNDIPHRVVKQQIIGNTFDSSFSNIKQSVRTIVPKCFGNAPESAGYMGFHEIVIDGKDFVPSEYSKLKFFINPESPIKIDIKNCHGCFVVIGKKDNLLEKFTWNKNEMNVVFLEDPSVLNNVKNCSPETPSTNNTDSTSR
jgi:hypothetical protein